MKLLDKINSFLWSYPLLFLLMGTHLYFTMKLHFPQIHILKALKLSVTPDNTSCAVRPHDAAPTGTPKSSTETDISASSVSPFAALATTLAATLGTGNIIGVSTAVALGGPGAVFWCWLTGVLGMATSYAECYLGSLFKEKNKEKTFVGGPMYVLKNGMHRKGLGCFYAVCTLLAAFGVGCTTQANSLAQTTSLTFGLSPHLVGIVAAVVTGLVLLGGIQSISKVCTRLVPVLGFLYIGSCVVLLFLNRAVFFKSIGVILDCAFNPAAALGGAAGTSLTAAARYGIARGLYTNEAGIGTASIAAASSDTQNPARQAYVSMTAVFWDTVVMCLLTGLVIVSNMLTHPESLQGVNETGLAAAAFTFLPIGGNTFLAIALIAFALTTLIGWSYLGERAVEFLFGTRFLSLYKLCYIVMIYIGAVIPLGIVWQCTDLVNAVMIFPNVIALYGLQRYISAKVPKDS